VADASLDVLSVETPPAGFPLFAAEGALATPHIDCSTEAAREIDRRRLRTKDGVTGTAFFMTGSQ
jgi:phosphoglycerate dehydrogenase-like enzyme